MIPNKCKIPWRIAQLYFHFILYPQLCGCAIYTQKSLHTILGPCLTLSKRKRTFFFFFFLILFLFQSSLSVLDFCSSPGFRRDSTISLPGRTVSKRCQSQLWWMGDRKVRLFVMLMSSFSSGGALLIKIDGSPGMLRWSRGRQLMVMPPHSSP